MKKVNFKALEEHVRTQFGDLTGIIQIDGHSNISSIYDLCKDYKFDTSDKFIIGFELGESTTNGIGRKNQVTCSVLYLEKSEYGDNFDAIEAMVRGVANLRLKKKNFRINYSEIGKYIKRYHFIVTSELTKYAATIEIDEDENEE